MKNLRKNFERFCLRNRDKGIPNLMLYIALGSGVVYLLSLINGGDVVLSYLAFDKIAILKGQVWRLVTFIFTNNIGSNALLVPIFLYFFYHLGRTVELSMGTLRFNLFYLSGVILMDLFAMIFCPIQDQIVGHYYISAASFSGIYGNMAFYLHISLLLSFATMSPDSHFLVFFIIPVKAWFLGVLYLVLIVIGVVDLSYPVLLFPHNLFPLVGLANYLLFTGKDVVNLFPFVQRRQRVQYAPKKTGTIPLRRDGETPKRADYLHKCTVCGRTDVSDPDMEFRYCSRCRGYHCYCEEHINNHSHIE